MSGTLDWKSAWAGACDKSIETCITEDRIRGVVDRMTRIPVGKHWNVTYFDDVIGSPLIASVVGWDKTNNREEATMSNQENVLKEGAAQAVVEIALNSPDGEFSAAAFTDAPEYTIEQLTRAAEALEDLGLLASTRHKTGILGLPVDLFVVTRAFRSRFSGVCEECMGILDGGDADGGGE